MSKTTLVAWHQMQQSIWRWSFLFVLLSPVLFLGLAALSSWFITWAETEMPAGTEDPLFGSALINRRDTPFEAPVGYVDLAGVLGLLPPDIPPEKFQPYPDETAAREAVAAGSIVGYYLIPAEYIQQGVVHFYSNGNIQFVGTDNRVETLLQAALAAPEGAPRAARILEPLHLTEVTVAPPTQAEGPPPAPTLETLDEAKLNLALGLAAFLFLIIENMGELFLGILVAEKDGRILEVVLGAVSPRQLLVGKLLGTLGVAFIQVGTWLFWFWLFQGVVALPTDSPWRLGAVLLVLTAGLISYMATMGTVGALIQSYHESSILSILFAALAVVPLLWLPALVMSPHSPVARLTSLFPLSAPLGMSLRVLLAEVPLWEVVLAVGLLLGWGALMVGVAVRLFQTRLVMTEQSLIGVLVSPLQRRRG